MSIDKSTGVSVHGTFTKAMNDMSYLPLPLITSGEITDEVSVLDLTKDDNGNPFSLSEFFIEVTGTLANDLESVYVTIAVGNGNGIASNSKITNSFKFIGYVKLIAPKQTISFISVSSDSDSEAMGSPKIDMWGNRYKKSFSTSDNFERIRLFPPDAKPIFAAGTKYRLYGR